MSQEQANLHGALDNCDEHGRLVTTAAEPNPKKEFGRRPRHKTRLDRYEPKHNVKPSEKPAKRDRKKLNAKKGRQRLSKVTIGEEFKPSNIKQDRITVRVLSSTASGLN
jgi:hypothetical protein